jgi:hypothetical protein
VAQVRVKRLALAGVGGQRLPAGRMLKGLGGQRMRATGSETGAISRPGQARRNTYVIAEPAESTALGNCAVVSMRLICPTLKDNQVLSKPSTLKSMAVSEHAE